MVVEIQRECLKPQALEKRDCIANKWGRLESFKETWASEMQIY